MSFISRIKSIYPVPWRSFRQFEDEVFRRLDHLEQTAGGNDPKTEMRFWALFQREGEDLQAAKERFFAAIPPATGTMRLLQDAQAKLLHEMHQLCTDNDIQYWATGGTLIGARRHRGFIPWDDDLDVAIMRDDLEKLRRIVETDQRYRVEILWDYRTACEQIRFRPANPRNPAFVDLFIFDWTNEPSVKMYQRSQKYRQTKIVDVVRDRFAVSRWPSQWLLEDSDPFAAKVREVFSQAREAEMKESYVTDREHATGIYRSIENFDDPTGFPYVGTLDDWFPAAEMEFEGSPIWVPRNSQKYLDGPYGDIWELPNDMGLHFEHVSHEDLENEEVLEILREYISE
ncbi:MAG: LicD family protein [Bifidobacteriaceae bacterium]|jgi:lipopolysaccharide cholinephosphotransferase|nr:LicD family protein [Bifidobacteriaceae bacterium]MCI1979434.1 LicD family protein [Bifidobacteriaceae bacterium]